MRQQRRKLGELLVEAGLVTEEQVQRALRAKKDTQRIGELLIQDGYITERQLMSTLERQLGIPYVGLYQYAVDKKAVGLVPKQLAKRYLLLPLKIENNKLHVAMVDPLDFFAVDDLRMATGYQIERALATKEDVIRGLNKYYGYDDTMEHLLEDAQPSQELRDEQALEDDSPVVKLVNQILMNAVAHKASDIHIDPHESKVVIRYRIDGTMVTDKTLPKQMQSMVVARIKIMSNLNITEHRIPQDGRIKLNLERYPIDIRVSTLPAIYGEKVVMRILDANSTVKDLDKMDFHPDNYRRFLKMIERPTGIVLITGPTGSGKSSTLYAALNRLNTEKVNIITVEDPVEYQLEGISQVQVNANVGLTFAAGLRAMLRQDPNIMMVGEIRDTETAEIATRAALTGHLVLSTLHTNDSVSTITRLIDMGIEPFLVAASLAGIVSQRLVRRVCRDCGQPHPPSAREAEIFTARGRKVERIFRGKGCGNCNMTGYKGRIAVHEVLVIDDFVRKLIMDNSSLSAIQEYARSNGTIFLMDDGLMKVTQGLTTTEEVFQVAIGD
ncbi:GspE/PulE family protein [Paenibacillus montanisoli]|uniref:Type II secretion system protein GspE n=1 Tax=Paenibacillus montanisoli TaxID=2081970 RepID=A0A328TZY7_9BACL|nr:ATPase, T2SS/T4P/T4SS family [Paenibacillus montanisoli]RAP74751.1 type II secretion system protein GspE [Paenibacillus montanisoli]